ncbi:AAEL000966-PA [Aedes aegypti]|uniref:AAEL000966-PA n=1 Tax=Aedes aegypti TaxID=7159 RepID=Q17MP2_AEDAE|nr:AAEL000966-PA [Aedes aegypti]
MLSWRYLTLAMIFVATAMLCKEQGITITGICAIYEIFVAQKAKSPYSEAKEAPAVTGIWVNRTERALSGASEEKLNNFNNFGQFLARSLSSSSSSLVMS